MIHHDSIAKHHTHHSPTNLPHIRELYHMNIFCVYRYFPKMNLLCSLKMNNDPSPFHCKTSHTSSHSRITSSSFIKSHHTNNFCISLFPQKWIYYVSSKWLMIHHDSFAKLWHTTYSIHVTSRPFTKSTFFSKNTTLCLDLPLVRHVITFCIDGWTQFDLISLA